MDFTHLTRARALLRQGRHGFIHKGLFTFLCADVHARNVRSGFELEEVGRRLQFILHDLWGMLTVCNRLEWMQREANKKGHAWHTWMHYASADVEHWHIKLRSLLDHVAQVIKKLANRRDQVPGSFSSLFDRCVKAEADPQKCADFVEKLGTDWFGLVKSAAWFPSLLEIRDQVIHGGAYTMVFWPPCDGILFQVTAGWTHKNLLAMAPLMFNENVVYFDRYGAHITSHLLLLLEDFSAASYNRLGMRPMFNGMNCHFGLGTLMAWIDSTLEGVDPEKPKLPADEPRTRLHQRITREDLPNPPGGRPSLIVGPDE